MGGEVTRRPVLMWSQEVCHNLQTDLSPEAPPPTDGASAQPMLRRLATAGSEDIGGIKKTPTRTHQSKLGAKQSSGGEGCCLKKKKKKKEGQNVRGGRPAEELWSPRELI